ncbi:HAD-IIIC family phosphatase [Bradyrhizobium sp. dw_411]|uniref:HAD-IIIC family phosphatase n=1 Tax=Bradyrhizobium sp. dw_411 TaxID=2720082 RepID=UPI00201C21AE|nr:HAD-IIIC family phosphatase [Bradyrhizobium sp. dw_411]
MKDNARRRAGEPVAKHDLKYDLNMILRRSRFVHQLPVGKDRTLIVHAISHMRLPADADVSTLIDHFAQPRRIPEDCEAMAALIAQPDEKLSELRDVVERTVMELLSRQILTEKTPEEELATIGAELSSKHGRDPAEMLEQYRRELKEGVASYWSVGAAYGLDDLGATGKRVDAILFGDCDIQMEADFLRREAARRGIDLHVSATFPDDIRFASEHKHDVIFIGALRARHLVAEDIDGFNPHAAYIGHTTELLSKLREITSAPILIDNLPEPTVQPLGLAERGVKGHRTRFRLTNVALAELASAFADVYVIDVAAALAAVGSERLLDDGQVGFTHFGSPGWMLQRPENEKAAVHNIFPDTAPLVQALGGDPYGRETVIAEKHIDALVTVMGVGRKKCVILDLDGTLWPGVLAETGSPFAWTPEVSGAFSYIGLYFGLHEALLSLKKRGVVLACVSKNDEATVRELWKYPDHYPRQRLLTPDDFVTWRVNWDDKVGNIRSIAEELGFALDTFLFIDDSPVERDRVRQRLPEVEVWGEDPFSLRRRLLNDPRLQIPVITAEAATRSALVKAQIARQQLRAETVGEAQYIESLRIQCRIERLMPDSTRLERVGELFARTTQFNTTGRKFSSSELAALAGNPEARIFAIDVSDRLGDHGLVGAAIINGGDITGFAISCRALGMGVEHRFLRHVLDAMKDALPLRGRIIPTPRNIPARNIYRDNGFAEREEGLWEFPK